MTTAAPDSRRWLLALHSCSDLLGVGLQPLGQTEGPVLAIFPGGRDLSSGLFGAIEQVLPAAAWPSLGRLAVAIGPGGFTGTRLTVTLARTLAQQLGIPLDGVGSFQLIAQRVLAGGQSPGSAPVALVQELPRHGLVAGLYGLDALAPGGVAEVKIPRLYRNEADLEEAMGAALRHPAVALVPQDVEQLLRHSQAAALAQRPGPWQSVLPIYPTSPVEVGLP
jgi:tRNA threonylcarbamoyl adenosine modification protein YeaZ